MLVSPAEPKSLRELGTVNGLPERWGADFLFAAHGKWIGIQRKTIDDLLASIQDGRLVKEVAQLQRCDHRILIIEGQVKWSVEGEMLGKGYGQTWTRKQWRGLLWSVRAKGIWIEWTDDTGDTASTITWIESWFTKNKHTTLDRRPSPSSVWGTPNNDDYARHLVMGLPGVGPELAERIVSRFGVPFCWNISQSDLLLVDGIGKKKAETIWKALEE